MNWEKHFIVIRSVIVFCMHLENAINLIRIFVMNVIPFSKYLKLNAQLNTRLAQLNFEEALFIVDYKMRILPKSARETKADFYGKRGWTLHSVLVYT